MAIAERPIILVVDDEESVRRSFDVIFRDDYEVVTVPDGEMALAKVQDLMPNLMFLDIRMPGMGGLEVLAEVRRIDEDLEVVVVTAVSDVATAIEAMKLGAFSYIIKPFDVNAIQQIASRALLKHRINLENRRFLESLTQENVRLRTQGKRLKRRLQATSHELHEMREGLAHASKLAALGETAAAIAHEIRNPLTVISAYIQLTRQHLPSNTKVLGHLDRVEREIQRLNRVAQHLMSYSSRSNPAWTKVPVNALVEDTLWLIRPKAHAQHVEVMTDYDASSPTVQGDRDQLTQVLLNLLVNACQAMPDGGRIQITTGVKGEGDDAQVTIQIADTGCGILEEHLPNIFQPFFTTKGKDGTGLGLAISSRIARDHQGTIDVQSEVGRGSVFLIALPSAPPDSAAPSS